MDGVDLQPLTTVLEEDWPGLSPEGEFTTLSEPTPGSETMTSHVPLTDSQLDALESTVLALESTVLESTVEAATGLPHDFSPEIPVAATKSSMRSVTPPKDRSSTMAKRKPFTPLLHTSPTKQAFHHPRPCIKVKYTKWTDPNLLADALEEKKFADLSQDSAEEALVKQLSTLQPAWKSELPSQQPPHRDVCAAVAAAIYQCRCVPEPSQPPRSGSPPPRVPTGTGSPSTKQAGHAHSPSTKRVGQVEVQEPNDGTRDADEASKRAGWVPETTSRASERATARASAREARRVASSKAAVEKASQAVNWKAHEAKLRAMEREAEREAERAAEVAAGEKAVAEKAAADKAAAVRAAERAAARARDKEEERAIKALAQGSQRKEMMSRQKSGGEPWSMETWHLSQLSSTLLPSMLPEGRHPREEVSLYHGYRPPPVKVAGENEAAIPFWDAHMRDGGFDVASTPDASVPTQPSSSEFAIGTTAPSMISERALASVERAYAMFQARNQLADVRKPMDRLIAEMNGQRARSLQK